MRICSRDFSLRFAPSRDDAELSCSGLGGRGEIIVGTKSNHLPTIAGLVAHEAMESILITDGKRFCPHNSKRDDSNIHDHVFIFNHEYLNDGFDVKVVDALVTSGFFKLVDGRRSVACKKKKKKGK